MNEYDKKGLSHINDLIAQARNDVESIIYYDCPNKGNPCYCTGECQKIKEIKYKNPTKQIIKKVVRDGLINNKIIYNESNYINNYPVINNLILNQNTLDVIKVTIHNVENNNYHLTKCLKYWAKTSSEIEAFEKFDKIFKIELLLGLLTPFDKYNKKLLTKIGGSYELIITGILK